MSWILYQHRCKLCCFALWRSGTCVVRGYYGITWGASQVGLSLHSPEVTVPPSASASALPQGAAENLGAFEAPQCSFFCLLLCGLGVRAGFITKLSFFLQRKKCLVAVPAQDDGDAVSGVSVVPAASESVVPEENTQTPVACTKPSKWEKFLSCSGNYSEDAARVTLSPQEGSGRLGLHSTTAADAGVTSRCSEKVGKTLPQGTGFEFRKCVASTEQLVSELPGPMVPSINHSVEKNVFKEAQSQQLIRAGAGVLETTARRCCLDSPRRTNTLGNWSTSPKPSSASCEPLFCTGEEFDDDL